MWRGRTNSYPRLSLPKAHGSVIGDARSSGGLAGGRGGDGCDGDDTVVAFGEAAAGAATEEGRGEGRGLDAETEEDWRCRFGALSMPVGFLSFAFEPALFIGSTIAGGSGGRLASDFAFAFFST